MPAHSKRYFAFDQNDGARDRGCAKIFSAIVAGDLLIAIPTCLSASVI
jgi:hypothetical protein